MQTQEIVLKRNSKVFAIAYGLSDPKRIPRTTSRCRLYWRCVWYALVVWPVFLIAGLMFILVTLLVSAIMVLVNGHSLRVISSLRSSDPDAVSMTPTRIERWPTIRGHRVWPIPTLVVGATMMYVALNLNQIVFGVSSVVSRVISWGSLPAIFFGFLLLALLVSVVKMFLRSEVGQLVVGYISDVKKGICPIITIEPPLEETEA